MSCHVFFFFKQKTAYEMRISDWSSDVCSSDLNGPAFRAVVAARAGQRDQLHGVDVGRAGVAGNLPRDLRLAVEILLVAHPLEDLERGFLRHRARFALRSEEHTSELQSLMRISYAVLCLKKKQTPPHFLNTKH